MVVAERVKGRHGLILGLRDGKIVVGIVGIIEDRRELVLVERTAAPADTRPFFLYVSFTAPHDPLTCPESFHMPVRLSRSCPMPVVHTLAPELNVLDRHDELSLF